MRWIFVFALFSQLVCAQGYEKTPEATCTSSDLRTDSLGEVRDQKKVSWCYAFTASDMLTYFFNLPEKASAADVAINYNDSDIGVLVRQIREGLRLGDRETFMMPHQTGFNKVALERGMKEGYCPERVFPSESWVKFTKVDGQWVESQSDLRPAMLEIYALLKTKKLTIDNLPYYFHFKNVETPEAFLELIKKSNQYTFYSKLRKEVCKYDRIKFQKSYPVTMYMKDPMVFKAINKELAKNRIVGIDYDSRILKDHTNRGVAISDLHTSSIVSRRWNKEAKECQYLIRNSYGSNCKNDRYDASYECQNGHIWLNESLVYPNLMSAVFVNK